jgi:hypothetical protein
MRCQTVVNARDYLHVLGSSSTAGSQMAVLEERSRTAEELAYRAQSELASTMDRWCTLNVISEKNQTSVSMHSLKSKAAHAVYL